MPTLLRVIKIRSMKRVDMRHHIQVLRDAAAVRAATLSIGFTVF